MAGPTPIPPSLDAEVIGAKQAARELGIHYQTLLARIGDGSLQAVKRGNRYYIRRRWLEAFLDGEPVSA